MNLMRATLGLVCAVLAGANVPVAHAQDGLGPPQIPATQPGSPADGARPLPPPAPPIDGAQPAAVPPAPPFELPPAPGAIPPPVGAPAPAPPYGAVPEPPPGYGSGWQPVGPAPTPPGGRRGHVGSEIIGGLGGVGASLALGLVVGGVAAAGCDSGGFCGLVAFAYGTLGFAAGVIFALPLGVYLAGNAAGGDGSYLSAFVGHLGGALLGTGIVALSAVPENETLVLLGIMGGVVIEFAGAILGYELSCTADPEPAAGDPAIEVVPTFAVLPGGASLGLVGVF